MSYITDTSINTTFPCNTVAVATGTVTVNMNSRGGFLAFSRGNDRVGIYSDKGNDIKVLLPGLVTGVAQQLRFQRL